MSGFEIYLILNLDSIIPLFGVMTFLLIMASLIFFALAADSYDEKKKLLVNKGKKALMIAFALLTITALIPSTKTVITMLTVPNILNDEKVQKIPAKILDIVDKKLDSILKEIGK